MNHEGLLLQWRGCSGEVIFFITKLSGREGGAEKERKGREDSRRVTGEGHTGPSAVQWL